MPSGSQHAIAIAGTGRLAQALGRLLGERGEPVTFVAGRNPERTRAAAAFIGPEVQPVALEALAGRAGRVLIAVSDDAIPEVARLLAASGMSSGIALHTCGAMGPEALASLAAAGVSCGAIHPLQTVPTPEQGLDVLPGAAYAIDGDDPALAWASRIAHLLGGETLRIRPEQRPLYHAAAVMASNYVVALVDAAAILLGAAGVGEDKALRAIGLLVQSSAANALNLGPLKALTGPIQRGDLETVSSHLNALAGAPASVSGFYRSAGLHALDLAERGGLAKDRARLIEAILRENEGGNG
jgi:predicted short-subunit dehydrogenase-like oxidoreductase (DUF2520 family)